MKTINYPYEIYSPFDTYADIFGYVHFASASQMRRYERRFLKGKLK